MIIHLVIWNLIMGVCGKKINRSIATSCKSFISYSLGPTEIRGLNSSY